MFTFNLDLRNECVLFNRVALNAQVRVAYRPVEAKVAPLSALRDKLTDGRQINALTLTCVSLAIF